MINFYLLEEAVTDTKNNENNSDEKCPIKVKAFGAEFPAKPNERGSIGREIRLKTNHFNIKIKQPFTVYQYDVDVTKLYEKKEEKSVVSKNIMK
jgi:hypothetical protein